MRRIGIITAGRSDFGIYRPVLSALQEKGMEVVIIATGTHMEPEFGETIQEIIRAGFRVDYQAPVVPRSDDSASVAAAMGEGMIQFSQIYQAADLSVLMVLGDRYEMFAAASAAVPFGLPIVHLHGGEITEGAMDDQFRHAMTKLSHIHFVSTETYKNRLLQMGEEPWRVIVSGAPGLDSMVDFEAMSVKELETSLGIKLGAAPIMVTFHPVTLNAEESIDELLAALETFSGLPFVFSFPNSDMGYAKIIEKLQAFVNGHPNAALFKSLGYVRYFSLMHHAAAMVGNSSSGIIEAATFGLPVVNIGSRQRGRMRGENIIDVPCARIAIEAGIHRALTSDYKGMDNPYGNGHAGAIIAKTLSIIELGRRMQQKKFISLGNE